MRRILAAIALWCAGAMSAAASQATLVTPGSPLPMSGLAAFLNGALLSIGSCNSGLTAPANGTGNAAFPGECWINTASNPWVFSTTADGVHWTAFGTLNTSTFVWTPVSNGYGVSLGGALTTAGALTQAGAFPTTLTATGTTNATLPAGTHTLGGLDVSQTWSGTNNFTGPFQIGGFQATLGGAFMTAAAFVQAGAFATTLTSTGVTNATLPAGTHTLGGLDVSQTWSGTNNFTGPFQIGGFQATLGGAFTTAAAFVQAGAFATTITSTGITNASLPAGTHTLGGLDVSQTWSGTNNFTGPLQISGTAQAFPASGVLVGVSDTQTLTNKTLTAPLINSPTINNGAWVQAMTAPAAPSSGYADVYIDSTTLALVSKNSLGTVFTTVVPSVAAANQFATGVNSSGSVTYAQPSAANLSNGTTGSGAVVLATSPAFTGSPTAPTPTAGNNSTLVATTAFVATSYAPLASPAFTGTPTAPTAAVSTNTTQVATTAFVLGQGGTATPIVDGAAAVGTSPLYARQDHVHPTDTTRAPLASPAFTGSPTAPTPTAGNNSTLVATTAFVATSYAPLASPPFTGTPTAPTAAVSTNTTQVATTAFVLGQGATATPIMDGAAAVGTSPLYARQDHVHPTDTTRAPLASPAFTGTPTAPTATAGTNTTQIATTAFVTSAVAASTAGVSQVNGLTGAVSIVHNGGGKVTSSGTTITIGDAGGFLNLFRNGRFDVWQRGTTGLSPGGYTADGWFVAQPGAAGSCAQDTGPSGAGALYALKCTGATGNTDTQFSQRIESIYAAPMAGATVTVQAQMMQNTGAAVTPKISGCYPSTKDVFASCTGDLAATSVTSCASGVYCKQSYTFVASANATNGYQITFDCNAALTASQSCWLAVTDIRVTPGVSTGVNSNPPPPELRPIHAEMAYNIRYFYKTYSQSIAPGYPVGAGGNGVQISGASSTQQGMTRALLGIMRIPSGTVTYYDGAGTVGKCSYYSGGWQNGGSLSPLGQTDQSVGFQCGASTTTAGVDFSISAEL